VDPPEEVRRGQVGTLGDPENPVHLSRPGHRCTRGAAEIHPPMCPTRWARSRSARLSARSRSRRLRSVMSCRTAASPTIEPSGARIGRQAHRHLEIRAIAPCPRRLVMAQTLPGCHPGEDLREVLESFFIEDLRHKAPNISRRCSVERSRLGSARHAPVHLDAHDGVPVLSTIAAEQRSNLLRALPIVMSVSDPQRADGRPSEA